MGILGLLIFLAMNKYSIKTPEQYFQCMVELQNLEKLEERTSEVAIDIACIQQEMARFEREKC